MSLRRSNKKLRLLFCGHDFKFLRHFIERCESRDYLEVRVYEHEGHHIHNPNQAREHLDWADVIFCEWALGNAVWFSHHKRDDQVLIVRLHLQEVQARERLSFIWQTDWSKVDRLILITQHVYDFMRAEFPVLRNRAVLVYNPIDAMSDLNRPKEDDTRHVLGLVGIVPARKRIDLAIELLYRLRKTDENYILRVKGKQPSEYPWMQNRTEEMAWYDQVYSSINSLGLSDHVVFDPHGPDMADWYAKIGQLVSVSDFEGSHQAVAEGMASGCVPAIRNWTGADRIYPPKYVASTLDGLADLIRLNTELDTFRRESAYSRRFAQERFDQVAICGKLEALILHAVEESPIELESIRDRSATRIAKNLPTIMIVAYIPAGNRGGYRIRVEQEIKSLIQSGCRVHLTCLLPKAKTSEKGRALQAHRREFEHFGCIVHFVEVSDFFRVEVSSSDFAEPIEDIAGMIRRFGVDVVHCEALYCGRIGYFVKEKTPEVIFSIDWHGVIPEEEKMNGAHEGRIRAMEKWEERLLKATGLNVFVSEAMGAHYEAKYGQTGSSSVLIPCCVSDERFGRGTQANHSTPACDISKDRLILTYAGTMAGWQCGREMINLFGQLYRHDPSVFFLLLVPEADHPKVVNWAGEFALPKEAWLMRQVHHDEVPAYLAKAHLGVLLRRDDPVNRVSSPTKFGEYLSAGIPVLMTECVGDYSALGARLDLGLVLDSACLDREAYAEEDLRQIVDYARRSREERASFQRRCQDAAYNELHWEPVIGRWLSRYKA